MPGLDGLGLLVRIRQDPRYCLTPVVLLTSASSAADMVEGFQAGASYYLTKPVDPVMLLAVVKVAVSEAVGVAEIRNQLREEELGLRLLKEARFEFRTVVEAKRLAALVAHAYPEPDRVLLGIMELLSNAVEHGNLAISYAEKGALIESNSLYKEIERRLELPEYRDRIASLRLTRTAEVLEIHIRDEGVGFDFRRYLDFHPDRALDPHGRGIAMARRTAFDELEYLGCGNEVKARVRLGN
jgi:response regulator RpfG family c-di-GMP phosphodiesterase